MKRDGIAPRASGFHADFARFLRFAAVGMSGTAVDFVLLTGLKLVLGWPTFVANPLSYSAGIVSNYTLNRRLTFRGSRKSPLAQFLEFAAVGLFGMILNTAMVHVLEFPFAALLGPTYAYLPAKLAATGLVAIWGFVANRFWTFRDVV